MLRHNKNNMVTRSNRLEFGFELKEFYKKILTLSYPHFNDDEHLVFLDYCTFYFLEMEAAQCNKFGLRLIFDDYTKSMAKRVLRHFMEDPNNTKAIKAGIFVKYDKDNGFSTEESSS